MTPAARRQAVAIAQQEHGLSRRRACRLVGISRSVVEREPRRAHGRERLRERLRALAGERRRFGYRRPHELLRREGWRANHKLVEPAVAKPPSLAGKGAKPLAQTLPILDASRLSLDHRA